ncbi:MAG: recombinase family protein, partial [Candidatus Thorarchaeota archaeon]
ENLFYYFEKNDVSIFIADMPHYNGKNSKDVLIRQIREAIAEENRKEIIDRLKRGREERIKKGRPAGGNVPYGYTRVNKEFKKNPDEVKIIKLIFFLKRNNMGGKLTADCLNRRGYKLRNGKRWTQKQVWSILNNSDLYKKGILKYGKLTGKDKNLVILKEND